MSSLSATGGTTEIKQFLTSLIGNAPIGILSLDLQGRCTLANERASAIFGLPPAALVDRELEQLLEGWPELLRAMPLPDEHGRATYVLDEVRRGKQTFSVSGRPIVSGVLLTFDDITDTVAMRDDQALLVEQLEQQNRSLEQFAAMAAHDLQAPMRFIVANTHLLLMDLEALDRPDLVSTGETLIAQGERMRALVLDLLEFCRAVHSELELDVVDTDRLFAEEIALLQSRDDYAATRIAVGQLPASLFADSAKLVQIVRNVLGNAVKFSQSSPSPSVRVDATFVAADGAWQFRIEDNGPGIDEQQGDEVFLPFRRLDSTSEGTGIGLAIVRALLERLGGRIWIDHTVVRGCAFCFAIPEHTPIEQS